MAADKANRPSGLFKVGRTGGFVREHFQKFRQVLGKILIFSLQNVQGEDGHGGLLTDIDRAPIQPLVGVVLNRISKVDSFNVVDVIGEQLAKKHVRLDHVQLERPKQVETKWLTG